MTDLIANTIFDKAYPRERINCEMLKFKKLEKDIKRILSKEKVIDYRCYLREDKQIIYYIAETKDLYIIYKEDLINKNQEALSCERINTNL